MPNNKNTDESYASTPVEVWRQVLGDDMHCHHGIWKGNEAWADALHNAVLGLARHVERGSAVVDLGCGWGGPAKVLEGVYGCSVLCVTVCRAQASYCADLGLETRRANLDHGIPEGAWSIGWWMESLEHLEEPEGALAALRPRCEKLVIRVNACESEVGRLFAGSMRMRSARFYLDALESAGWAVTHTANRRSESLRSASEWLAGLRRAGASSEDPHLRALWAYSLFFATAPSMYANFPLMDIIAE